MLSLTKVTLSVWFAAIRALLPFTNKPIITAYSSHDRWKASSLFCSCFVDTLLKLIEKQNTSIDHFY